ncbi:alkaline phosphatase [Fulvivirga maritima]|uniref:alkaline phosphatase n=1 Tax=Fulvivirga maritima TaxID=2904247 RepID=UPI001F46B71A|nr:alkaline phosphatase [Fulvivirga maritima]UII28725.1 alkaline phosphatase [Fulvivirga maritima]
MKSTLILLLMSFSSVVFAQKYATSIIFAHNDYQQAIPLYAAYQQRVGYIEADVFLVDGELMVAHTKEEVNPGRTLAVLYLEPLHELVAKNRGLAYGESQQKLTLMIDLKTDGLATIKAIVKELEKFPALLKSPTFKIMVSGNVPDPAQWDQVPEYIHFDGHLSVNYTPTQLQRVEMISADFTKYTQWNGKGVLTTQDAKKVKEAIAKAHDLDKKIRFWAAPDFINAWIELRKAGVDILNSDHVEELAAFINGAEKNFYVNEDLHEVYTPKNEFKKKSPKNVILLIGDGTGLAQWYAGYTANGGALSVFNIKHLGYSKTDASDSYITDSAAGGSAMAGGKKTKNRYIGVDPAGNPLPLITEILKKNDFNTAIISDGNVTDATPASFYAHVPERGMSEEIAADFLKSDNDILIGGGYKTFTQRKDERNLVEELKEKGYYVSTSFEDIHKQEAKTVLLDEKVTASIKDGRGDFLTQALMGSIEILEKQKKPFFIMEESAQIDWGGHGNDVSFLVKEVLDFDIAIGEAMKYVDENQETLLIITADHETGGLAIVGGDFSERSVRSTFTTNDHTGVMVPVFAYGPGSELFQGIYDNTEIYSKILSLLKVK